MEEHEVRPRRNLDRMTGDDLIILAKDAMDAGATDLDEDIENEILRRNDRPLYDRYSAIEKTFIQRLMDEENLRSDAPSSRGTRLWAEGTARP